MIHISEVDSFEAGWIMQTLNFPVLLIGVPQKEKRKKKNVKFDTWFLVPRTKMNAWWNGLVGSAESALFFLGSSHQNQPVTFHC